MTKLTQQAIDTFGYRLLNVPHLKEIFDASVEADQFFSIAKGEMASYTKAVKSEIYYAYKIGKYSAQVSPSLMYAVKRAYEEHGSISLVLSVLPKDLLKDKHRAEGVTLEHVIRDMTGIESPIATEDNPIVYLKSHTELYITPTEDPSIGFVILIPADARITYSDVDAIKLSEKKDMLYLKGEPLHEVLKVPMPPIIRSFDFTGRDLSGGN